ncbi:MAG: hypothetical protein V7668_20790, partial [Cereibacter changlensis]
MNCMLTRPVALVAGWSIFSILDITQSRVSGRRPLCGEGGAGDFFPASADGLRLGNLVCRIRMYS